MCDRTVVNLSRGLGEAFGHEIISWETDTVAQMLHPYIWLVYAVFFILLSQEFLALRRETGFLRVFG
ncbi:MAG: hypothetical protein HC942_22615 [Microcoleus sp. SU_5_6]|nr:hypothetical protein [Microcoleus sp. SU_5_6]